MLLEKVNTYSMISSLLLHYRSCGISQLCYRYKAKTNMADAGPYLN